MKKSLQIMFLALLLLGTACQHEELDTGSGNDGYVEFRFTKPDNETSTRANIAEDGNGTFTEGDSISLYITAEDGVTRHIVLTLKSGAWTPQLKKSDLGKGRVTLDACYPADRDAAEVSSYAFSLSADQSGKEYESSDLLRSHRCVDMARLSGNRIELSFSHAMHRLVVELESKDGRLPEDLTVSVRGYTEGTVSLSDGKATPAESSEPKWIAARKLGDGRYCAVFYPQKLKQDEEWVKITTPAKESVYKSPATVGGNSSLEQGKQTVLHLILRSNGTAEPEPVPGDWGGKKTWVYGVSSPVYPDAPEEVKEYYVGSPEKFPLGEWFRIRSRPKPQYIQWKAGCGWYDCNKIQPDNGGLDQYMCWAATASNLLHWWMNLNREYIAAYDDCYGSTPNKQYPRPSADYGEGGESALFDFFRRIAKNKGADEESALNWFLAGAPPAGIAIKDDYLYNKFPGYFGKVLTSGTEIAQKYISPYKEEFNSVIKNALERNQALAFDVHTSLMSHAMTIWGAEFDADGNVAYLYYADNNDRHDFEVQGDPNNYQRSRCIRASVAYSGAGVSVGGLPLMRLVTLDLCREAWKKAFPEIGTTENFRNGK